MPDIYQINVGLITYMKMKGTELLGAVQTSSSPHRVSAFISAISSDILALPTSSSFEFWAFGKRVDPRTLEVHHHDSYSVRAGGPFFARWPYTYGNAVMFLTEADSNDAGDRPARYNPAMEIKNLVPSFDSAVDPNQ